LSNTNSAQQTRPVHVLWIIFVGFVAGIVSCRLLPGPNTPSGFVLTILLGIAGAFLAT
jgi:uncharacterized membrane protein YeaQ/YmgE (transglycosylase-associated protein family)